VEVAERGPGAPSPPPAEAGPPSPQLMLRERRALARRREIELRDVGGLTVEMVRRERFKPELLHSRANEVLDLEGRINELDSLLAAEAAVRGIRHVPHCRCGAPLAPGVHFCSHCGRPAEGTQPVLACTHCGQALPADVNFCPFCGHAVAAEEYLVDTDAGPGAPDATLVRPAPEEPPSRDDERAQAP
jgi:Double zinc ribbon